MNPLHSRPSADLSGVPANALAVWVRLPVSALAATGAGDAFRWALLMGNAYPGGDLAALLPATASLRTLREYAARRLGLVAPGPHLLPMHSEVTPPGSAASLICDVRAVLA